jgi:hypothetical protein
MFLHFACQDRSFERQFAAMSHCRGIVARCPAIRALIVVAPILLASAPALAAKRHAQQERTARRACLNGDYSKGVAILSDLFVDTKDPTYIFNQGRCFEQNSRYEDAAARFEEYLRVAGDKASPEDRAAAEKHLADCREKVAREHPPQLAQPEPLVPPPPVVTTTPEPAVQPETATEPAAGTLAGTAPPAGPGRRRWGLITAGIITATVGVGGVVTGLVFNLKANGMVNDWETTYGSYSTNNETDQKTYKTVAWVGYGVGAACVVAGAVLIGFGVKSRTSSSASVALVPSVGPGQMGATLTGAF